MTTLMFNLDVKIKMLKVILNPKICHLFITMIKMCLRRNPKKIVLNLFLSAAIKTHLKKRFLTTETWMIEYKDTKFHITNLKKNRFKMSHATKNLRLENVYVLVQ